MTQRLPKPAAIGLMISNQPERKLLAEFLRQADYEVTLFTAADLSRDTIAESLIIVDESSAGHHGAAFLALKRRLQPLILPVLLAMTGNAGASSWLRAGFDDVLRLPLNKDDLLVRLETFLRLRRHSEEAIEESAQRFQATFDLEHFVKSTIDALSQHICVLDAAGNILTVNKAWRDFASANGLPSDAPLEGVNYLAVCDAATGLAADDARALAAGMRAVTCGELEKFTLEYTCHSLTEQRWFIAKVTRFPEGGLMRLVIAHENISQIKQAQKHLSYLTSYDTLTGLPNRALLQDRLQQAITRANRSNHALWVVSLDIDGFKFINDTFGHKVGDGVLGVIAGRLQANMREADTLARFGGDEFVLILAGQPEENIGMIALQRLMSAVAEPLVVEGNDLVLTCSVGIAVYPADEAEPEILVQHADTAMHRAKQLGHNNYQFYTSAMNDSTLTRMRFERHLRHALEHDEFVLHYQPQADLRTGAIVGMEALIRWRHPELGMVPPASFIGLAEETGLILPIGAWVIRTACIQNKRWQDAGLGHLRIAVNLSARQFAQKDLVQSIAAILQETGLAPQYLDIELTESIVMTEVERTIGILRQLKQLGVQLSIDDFGTGYSSLSYLKRFPIDVLKIDQSFVRDIMSDSGSAAISNAIISMAHSLGIEVVAEGVETEEQCEFLSRNMCDEIQGYWFSRPQTHQDIELLLRAQKRIPPHLLRLQKPPRTLLLVDDEPNVLASLKRLLRSGGYRVLTAGGGREGLEVLAQHKVDVIVSDQRMPGMSGVQFLRKAKGICPDTLRIVLSGYTELQSITDAVNEGSIYRFLTKPWEDHQLRLHIEEAFQFKEMADENRRLNLKIRTTNQELALANRQLEEVLLLKKEQLAHHEISLAIVREALQHVPVPVIGLDEENFIVFANLAAQGVFKFGKTMLGNNAREYLPELLNMAVADSEQRMVELNDIAYRVNFRSMGVSSTSRGWLMMFTR